MEDKTFSSRRAPAIIITIIILLLAATSEIAAWSLLNKPETYSNIVQSIDKKKANVTSLIAGSASASAAITLIPDDVGTPIAEQLAEMADYLLLVLGTLYLEKYLLTIIGPVAAGILLPLGCIFIILYIHRHQSSLFSLGIRILSFSMILLLVIPCSMWVSDKIEGTYKSSIDGALNMALQAEEVIDAGQEQRESLWQKIAGAAEDLFKGASDAVAWAKNVLGYYVEAIVIMIITNCVVPILTLLFFVWVSKILLRPYVPNARLIKHEKMPKNRNLIQSRMLDDEFHNSSPYM